MPLAAAIIVAIPVFNAAVQIELMTNRDIPVHWALVAAVIIGIFLSAIVQIIKKVYEDLNLDLETEIKKLKNEITLESLRRDIIERDLMLNSACLNENWLIKNATVEQLEAALKKKS